MLAIRVQNLIAENKMEVEGIKTIYIFVKYKQHVVWANSK